MEQESISVGCTPPACRPYPMYGVGVSTHPKKGSDTRETPRKDIGREKLTSPTWETGISTHALDILP